MDGVGEKVAMRVDSQPCLVGSGAPSDRALPWHNGCAGVPYLRTLVAFVYP